MPRRVLIVAFIVLCGGGHASAVTLGADAVISDRPPAAVVAREEAILQPMDAVPTTAHAGVVAIDGDENETEIGTMFDDCELGAEPPFGNLYDVQTIMDTSLEKDDHIKFQAGTHDKAISMGMDDYRKLVKPKVLEFSYHVMS